MEEKIRRTKRCSVAVIRQSGFSSHIRRIWILRAATVFSVVAVGLLAWQIELSAKAPLRLYATTSDQAQSQPTLEVRPTFLAQLVSLFRHEQPSVTGVQLTDATGRAVQASFHATRANQGTSATIALSAPTNLRPGKYSATVTTLRGTATQTMTQDFVWGVLALNVPSATVESWQDVPLHLAVLDDRGGMVCDATVSIVITTPGGKSEQFQTGDAINNKWRIRTNPACTIKARTEQPDYEAHYRPVVPGTYSVHVIADTKNGRRELTDSFRVQEHVPFLVKRNTFPTRIYPAAAYPVGFTVHPNAAYQGTFTELVPSSFAISAISGNGTVRPIGAEQRSITWNVDWKVGQEYKIGYAFDAPDASPAFYQLGPFQVGNVQEPRRWQLAIDGSEQFIAFTDGVVPSGWTCISCTAGDPFYQKFPRGNTTYGGTGGATTHTHTMALVSTVNSAATVTTFDDNTLTAFAASTEEHTSISGTTVSSATNLPQYRDLKVIRYNNAGSPSTLPSGIIAPFDAAPTGSWTRYTNQDGSFIYGENDSTGTGGSATHTHTFSGTLASNESAPGTTSWVGTLNPANASVLHTHTFSGSIAAQDHTPSRVDVLLYQTTAVVPTPPGILGLWSGTPPSGWTSVSGVGGDYNGRMLRGASAYALPAANGTHTPSNSTITSSAATGIGKHRSGSPSVPASAASHTHSTTVSFGSTDNLPPYFDAIIAKKDAAVSATLSGTIYSDDGSTAYNCETNNLTVAIRVNGAGTYSGTCTLSNGAYSIGSVSISAGDVVTVFLDGETEKAVTVTRSSNASISGLDLYQNQLIVRDEDGSPMDNANLGQFDGDDDTDIPYTSNDSALSVSSGTELHIWTGKTFTPGGSVTTTASSTAANPDGDVHIATSATLSMGTNALSIGGDYNNAGTLSKSTGQITTFTATATGFSITPGTGNFDSLTFNGSGGGWSPSAALAVDVDLTMMAGTLSGTQNVTVNGAVAGTSGSIALTGGTFTQRVGAAKNFGTTSGSVAWSFNSLTFSNSAGTSSTITTQSGGTGSITVAGTLTVGDGSDTAGTTLDLSNRTWIFTGTSPISVTSSPAATLTINTSTIRFATTSALTVPLTYSYYNLELRPNGSGTPNYTLGSGASQTLTVTNSLTFGDGTNAVTIKADTYNPATNVAGSVTVNAAVTFTKGSGTFTFNGTTAATYTDSTATPQNLGIVALNKTDTVAAATNDKLTLASSMTVDTMTVDGTAGQADTLNLGASGYTLKLANAGATTDVLAVSGTFTAGTSTVDFAATDSSGAINVPILAYSSVLFSGAENYDLAGNLTSGNKISGSVSVSSGATLDATASNYGMEVGGNWTIAGAFTPRAGTVTFNGISAQTVTTGNQAFSGLTINNTGTVGTANDDIIPSGTLTVGGTLTITQGELKLSSNNPAVAVAGSFSIGASGIFTKGTGALTFDGTAAATFTDSTSAKQNLGTVSLNKTNTSSPSTNDKLTLASSMTVDTMTIDGTAGQADTINLGSSGYTLKLVNAGSSADVLTVNGTLTIGTSTVDYAATNSGGSINVVGINYSSLSLSGAETYIVADDITVSGTLTTESASTLSVSSGKKVSHTGSSMTNNGTISGSGTLRFTDTSSGPGTGGTISTIVQYDASSADIGSSTVDARTYNGPVDFYANTTVDRTITLASGTYTLSGSSANLTETNNGTGTLTIDATANPDVSVGGSFSFAGTGTETLKTGTGTWTVSGNANFSNGILTATSGNTLAMNGTGATLTTAGQSLSNLSIAGSVTSSGNVTLGGDLTINGAFTAPSGTLTLGGGFNNDGSFANNGGTVVFNASSGTQHIDADGTGSESYYNVTFSGSASWNMDSSVTVENTFTQSAGTIYAPQTTLAVAGNFVHSGGTFVGNGGIVLLNGSDQTISGTTTFANLTKTVTTARTLTFPAGATQTVTGTLTLQGAVGAALSLRSSSAGTQWLLDPQGTRALQYVDVQDSNNTNITKIATSGLHMTNSGNNTGWAFPPSAPTGFSGTAVSSTSILWTWTDTSSDETGFKLESADGTVLLTVDSANTQSVTETGLVRGTAYTRQVVAYNADGVSEPTATDTVETNASAPTVPELIDPSANALLNTLTPAFSFHRSTDDDDGMGIYTLFLNPNTDDAKTVFLGNVPTSGSESRDSVIVTGTTDTGTARLTDDTLLREGANTWQIRALDSAGNPSDSVVRTLVIDITKPTLTAFSLEPQARGSKESAYLSTSRQPTLTLSAQDNYQLGDTIVHFLRHRFLLGEEIGTTEELALTIPMAGTSDTEVGTPKIQLPYGVYTLRIEAFDAAGNRSTTERSVTLQTAEKIAQRPTAPGTTPSEEREKEIDQGTTPTKVPEDLTLPNLEKHAFERRQKEAANLTVFLLHFIPKSWLDRFELAMNRVTNCTRSFLIALARSSGRRLASLFGFSSDALAQLRLLLQLPSCGADCATQEQIVRTAPLGSTLDSFLPKVSGRAIVALKTFQNHATRLLIAGRKNRSQVASNNEAIIARSLQPVTRAAHWIGVGVRVALEGMRGKYEQQLQITNVAIKVSTPTATTITWTTNRVSKGKVNYGQTISYGQEALEQSFAFSHTIELKGLQPSTKYYFEVLATDTEGEDTFDAYYGFTTLAP